VASWRRPSTTPRCSTGPDLTGPELLFVGHGAERSGPPVFLANLQRWLDVETDLAFATVLARGGPLVAAYLSHGPVRVLDGGWTPARLVERGLGRVGRSDAAERVRAVRDRRRLGDWSTIPAVYVNTVATSTLRVLAQVPASTTVVVHVHEMEAALRYGIGDDDRRLLVERPQHYVAASVAVADNLVANHGVSRDRIAVHHEIIEPVDPPGDRAAARRRLGLPEDAFVVGGSGMTEWRKAPDLFVRIAAELRARTGRPLCFVWVGGATAGPEWVPLDHEARHLGVDDVVRFVGGQHRPGDWFGVLDAFALTSREDAYPLAALEAVSASVPLVTFDTGGIVELVGDGEHGVVVPYPDTAAFADALAGLAEDDDARRALGAAGAAAVRSRHVPEVGAPPLWADLATWIGR
jgi:glycosyltransferase involved in cell wall biosynthesis